jgi:poly(beta-D-mannuronate) lyase
MARAARFFVAVTLMACVGRGSAPPARADVAAPAFAAAPPVRPAALRGPYAPAGTGAAVMVMGAPAAPRAAIPTPPRDLFGVSYYADDASSIVDPAARARNERAVAPVRAMIDTVDDASDRWLRAGAVPDAAAALDALAVWAHAGALLGSVNRQGGYMRQWALAAFALDYLKIRAAPGLDAAARALVERWLLALGRAVDGGRAARNNHAYWCGLAVMAAGIAAGDAALYDAGLARFAIFTAEIAPDGTLPLEEARRGRALHYHLFALDALVMMAELAADNGADLYAAGDHAIARLVARCLGRLREAGAGVPSGGDELCWLEPYYARFHPPELAPWVERTRARPVRCAYLGGDLTLAFARRAPAPDARQPSKR